MIKIGQIGMAHDHAEGKMSCVRKFPDVFEIVGIAEENPENIKNSEIETATAAFP